jgi:di/tripeptidase
VAHSADERVERAQIEHVYAVLGALLAQGA